MIVIAIIGILAAILIPNFVKARAQAQLTGCKENLKNLSTAVEMYNNDNLSYPLTGNLNLITPNYLKVIPSCESTGVPTYGYAGVQEFYSICCSGSNHIEGGVNSANYPQYSGYAGLVMP
jgi:type II secretory pathway pseudopilin PulG